MTPFDIATGTLIITIPLIVCAGIIGFFIGEARAKRDLAPTTKAEGTLENE